VEKVTLLTEYRYLTGRDSLQGDMKVEGVKLSK